MVISPVGENHVAEVARVCACKPGLWPIYLSLSQGGFAKWLISGAVIRISAVCSKT